MNWIHFISYSHIVSIFGPFWPFLTPYCASHWAHGPHTEHNPEVYYLSVESAKKWTLIIDSVQYFDFSSFAVIFSHFQPLGGLLEAFMGPCYGLLSPTGPHMELGPQMCNSWGSVGKNNAQIQ